MNESKVFRDPLYGYVKVFDPLIWELIQTIEFQRLRRIHQLGGTSMVYHTAEHSRFSHSLGVYEVARRILHEVDQIRTKLSKNERLITMCAALLHDIGHGPYSHAYEYVFNTNHEQYTIDIINGESEVHQVLERYQPGFARQVALIINKKCYKLGCNKINCNHNIMVSLISSQLDADRLDYLQRDAYNTGATYGEIDLDRIIRSILVVDNKLAFKYSGMHAIENYLMSRYHMYWQVYYHPVSISHEILLVKIFSRVKDLIDEGYVFKNNINIINKSLNNQLTLKEYLELDEVWLNYHIKEWIKEEDEILNDLSSRLIHRKLFKYINCRDKEELDITYNKLSILFNQYKINTRYYLHKDTLTKEAYQYYTDEVLYNSPILLYQRNNLVEIAEISHIVKGIKDIGAKKDYKIYFPNEVKELFSDSDLTYFNDIYTNQ